MNTMFTGIFIASVLMGVPFCMIAWVDGDDGVGNIPRKMATVCAFLGLPSLVGMVLTA